MRRSVSPEEVDTLLPQTQCGLCGHGGCLPYAESLVFEQAAINLCPPGGVETLRELGKLLDINPEPYLDEMQQKSKSSSLAMIREAECIGCTKCIQACPVDAIIGSARQMHTVITAECTGCELCIPPCPVDCIDLLAVAEESKKIKMEKAKLARERFNAREQRLKKEKDRKMLKMAKQSKAEKLDYIKAAIRRAKVKFE